MRGNSGQHAHAAAMASDAYCARRLMRFPKGIHICHIYIDAMIRRLTLWAGLLRRAYAQLLAAKANVDEMNIRKLQTLITTSPISIARPGHPVDIRPFTEQPGGTIEPYLTHLNGMHINDWPRIFKALLGVYNGEQFGRLSLTDYFRPQKIRCKVIFSGRYCNWRPKKVSNAAFNA